MGGNVGGLKTASGTSQLFSSSDSFSSLLVAMILSMVNPEEPLGLDLVKVGGGESGALGKGAGKLAAAGAKGGGGGNGGGFCGGGKGAKGCENKGPGTGGTGGGGGAAAEAAY